eukprot:scaffold94302_cov37-Phaeocystis_antarctica.AAC.2
MRESRPLTVGSSFRFLATCVISASIDSIQRQVSGRVATGDVRLALVVSGPIKFACARTCACACACNRPTSGRFPLIYYVGCVQSWRRSRAHQQGRRPSAEQHWRRAMPASCALPPLPAHMPTHLPPARARPPPCARVHRLQPATGGHRPRRAEEHSLPAGEAWPPPRTGVPRRGGVRERAPVHGE